MSAASAPGARAAFPAEGGCDWGSVRYCVESAPLIAASRKSMSG